MALGKIAKKRLCVLGWVLLFALNWLALDDITTGNETNYWGEWAIVIVSGVFVLMYVVYRALTGKSRK